MIVTQLVTQPGDAQANWLDCTSSELGKSGGRYWD